MVEESWIPEHMGHKEQPRVKERGTHCQSRQPTEGLLPGATHADVRHSGRTPCGAQEHGTHSDSLPVKPSPSQGQPVLATKYSHECKGSGA